MNRRKELKDQYKNTEQPVGIYQIRNTETGKVYIGKSQNLNGAFNAFRFQLKTGLHKNKNLQDDWKKYGEDKFVFEILEQIKPSDNPFQKITDDLDIAQEIWVEKLAPDSEKEYR